MFSLAHPAEEARRSEEAGRARSYEALTGTELENVGDKSVRLEGQFGEKLRCELLAHAHRGVQQARSGTGVRR